MKIAVFDHIGNFGGGVRFCRALLLALKKKYPNISITYFGRRSSIAQNNLHEEFSTAGITVKYIHSFDIDKFGVKIAHFFHTVQNILPKHLKRESLFRFGVHKRIELLAKGYDIAFFPWPYLMECPTLKCPMVGVFHDFNYKYFFGTPVFSAAQYNSLNRQIPVWLNQTQPIVSSHFTASEIAKFYPTIASKLEIVHLAPFSISKLSEEEALKVVNDLAISGRYILYPTNLCQHKNLGTLFRAMYLLQQNGIKVTLVITGPGTECVTGKASAHGIERKTEITDVIGLGYVSNLQIDALIRGATAVVSTSLYEAGNGPGLEAWSYGIPVIMSNIPSFSEHLSVLGVKAQLVDPYNAQDIAEKIKFVLTHYDQSKVDALQSLESLRNHTWEKVAIQYYEIFCKVMQ